MLLLNRLATISNDKAHTMFNIFYKRPYLLLILMLVIIIVAYAIGISSLKDDPKQTLQKTFTLLMLLIVIHHHHQRRIAKKLIKL